MLRILLLLGTTILCASAQSPDIDYESLSVYFTTKYIEDQGYVAETHHVTTEDGYILEMHRIPYPRHQSQPAQGNRPVVFLMHGLTSASIAYVFLGHEYSMAYILADAGFDVWLGNQRGNKNSRHHVTLDPDDPSDKSQFFDFSWEEIGMYDLPAMIDYILNATSRQKLHYIGHSQGGTVFLVMGSMRPEYNAKIASAHLLAGVGYQQYFPDEELTSAAALTDIIYSMAVGMGMVELFPPNSTETEGYSALDGCLGDVAYKEICDQIGVRKYSLMRFDENDNINNNSTDTGNGNNADIDDNNGNGNSTDIDDNNISGNGTDIDDINGNGNSTDIEDNNSNGNNTDIDDNNVNGNHTDIDDHNSNGNGTDIEDIISNGNNTDIEDNNGSGDTTDIDDNIVNGNSTDIDDNNSNNNGNGTDVDESGPIETEDSEEDEFNILDDYFGSSDARGGGALKQVAHYGQNIRDKAFRRWNYGLLGNLVNYLSFNPPSYNLGLITCNVTMHYTINDALLDERDVLAMAADMPYAIVRKVARTTFLHEDFAGALDAKELVTDYMIEDMLYIEENLTVEVEEDQDSDTAEGVEVIVVDASENESEDDSLDTNEDLTEEISEGGDDNDIDDLDADGNEDSNIDNGNENENTVPVVEPSTDSSNTAALSITFKMYLILSSIYCIFRY